MGTRSLTHVLDRNNKTLVTIYRQMDGYPAGMGAALKEFLSDRIIVNGFGPGTPEKASNGMECLAASLVGHLKGEQIGSIYLFPPNSDDVGEEWTYTIGLSITRKIYIKVQHKGTLIYEGPVEMFNPQAKF